MCAQADCTCADSTVREQMAKRSTNLSLRWQGTKWIFLAPFILSRRASFSLLEPCRDGGRGATSQKGKIQPNKGLWPQKTAAGPCVTMWVPSHMQVRR